MVLEDAFQQASSSEDGTLGGNDPVIAGQNYRIPHGAIVKPDPITMYTAFFGKKNWEKKLTPILYKRADHVRVQVNRLPTRAEMDAFVTIDSRAMYHAKIGTSVGIAAGLAQFCHDIPAFEKASGQKLSSSVRTFMSSVKRPFFQQASPGNPQAGMSLVVTAARMILWFGGAQVLATTYAAIKMTVDMRADPRLKNYCAEILKQDPEEMKKRRIGLAMQRMNARNIPEPTQAEVPEQEYGSVYTGSEQDTSGATPGGIYQTQDTRDSQPSTLQSDNVASGELFAIDEASPTAPEYRNDDGSMESGPHRSAWELIRQRNATLSSRNEHAPTRQPISDKPDFLSYESGKQQEREKAKADFDKMLEAERNRPESL